jgi:Gpi18-like mannosyltransferase
LGLIFSRVEVKLEVPEVKDKYRSLLPVWLILGAAFLLRLFFIPSPGYENDVNSFSSWMRTSLEHGVAHVSEVVLCDYPPGYLYILKAVGLLWQTITNLPIPADGTVAIRFLVKIIPILADLAGAYVLYLIANPRLKRKTAFMVLTAHAFNPAIIFNSAVWGQVDSLTALLIVLSLWRLSSGNISLAFGLATFAILVKFQAVVVIPILFIGAFYIEKGRGVQNALKGSALASLVLLFPFFQANRVDSVIYTALGTVGRYPYISLHAHNLWWLIGGKASRSVSDATRIGNAALSYHDIGMIIFVIATLLIMWRLWRDLKRSLSADLAPALFHAATLEMMAFYLFPTQMHERYIVPAIITLAALCIWKPKVWWLYCIASLGIFVSLASTLNTTYLHSVGPLAALFPPERQETYVISAILLAVFFILFFWLRDRRFTILSLAVIALSTAILAIIAFAPLKGPQLLSKWAPVESKQDWGKLYHDRTVDDHRLSVAGFIFGHGIGTHANSRIIYHLNGAFREFDTAFGIDDEANRGQKVQYRILTDGIVKFDSGIINGGGWPRHIRVDITGAEYLILEVLDGGDGINYDHADWLEPVLYR